MSSSTGSPTATPSISPSMSCSAAAIAAPPPLETDEAITIVLPELNLTFERPVAELVRELLVQHVEREPDRVQRVGAPVLFRVLLRVRVLDREPVRIGGVERGEFRRRQRGGEIRTRSPAVDRIGAHAVLQIDGVGREIVNAGAGALVGVGDRAAVLQAPFAGAADRAVDAARAGRRRRDDAGGFAGFRTWSGPAPSA